MIRTIVQRAAGGVGMQIYLSSAFKNDARRGWQLLVRQRVTRQVKVWAI